MGTETEILLISTTSTPAEAESLARLLVDKNLVACVNIVPHLTSVFRWEGEIATESESLLIMKSTHAHFAHIERLLKEHHSYKVPELIAIPIVAGSTEYLSWIHEATRVPS